MLSDPALWLPTEAEDHQIHQLEGQPLRQPARKPLIGGWWKVELVTVTGILYGPPFSIGSCPGHSKLEGGGQDTRWSSLLGHNRITLKTGHASLGDKGRNIFEFKAILCYITRPCFRK